MAVVMMARADNLGALPFSDYADPDPDALPFDDAAAETVAQSLAAMSRWYQTHDRTREATS